MTQYYKKNEKINWLALPEDFPKCLQSKEKFSKLKPIWIFLVAMVFLLIISTVLVAICAAIGNLIYPGEEFSVFTLPQCHTLRDGSYNPIFLIANVISVASAIPALALSMKIFGLNGIGVFSSVAGKLRWDCIKSFAPWAILIAIIIKALQLVISIVFQGPEAAFGTITFSPIVILLILVLVPIQCAAEEYVFRGLALQTFSSWIPILIIPLLLQTVLFGLMHSQYNIFGWIITGFAGLVMGFLAIKTGGLEASICLHVVNNIIVMIMSTTFSAYSDDTLITADIFIASILISAGCGFVLLWVAKRKGYLVK